MKNRVKYSEDQRLIITQIGWLSQQVTSWKKVKHYVSLERILELCTEAFNADSKCFIGRVDHKNSDNKTMKVALVACCRLFSNAGGEEIFKFTQTTRTLFYNSLNNFYYEMHCRRKACEILVNLSIKLNKITNNRLFNLREVALTDLKGHKSDWSYLYKLTPYQVAKIPIRPIEWFRLAGTSKSIVAVSDNPKIPTTIIVHSFFSDEDVLLMLQHRGYRFALTGDGEDRIGRYAGMNPTCETCIHKHGCKLRFNPYMNHYLRNNCFEQVSTENLRIPAELLTFEHYHLQ